MSININKYTFLLITIGILVFGNILFNGFVWDDEEQILNNGLIHSLSNFPQFFSGSTFNSGGSGSLTGLYYKPLMTVFFAFLYSIFGASPSFFHLFQLIIHISSSVILFWVFRLLLEKHGHKNEFLSFILALIFLIHPINSETVDYVANLQDILFFFFGILALFLTIKQRLTTKRSIVIGLLLLCSLLSKETGILFIPLIISYLFLFRKKESGLFVVNAGLAFAVYSFLRFVVAGIYFNKHGLSLITQMSLWERLLSLPQIIFYYIKTFVFPKDLAINQQWAVTSIDFNNFWLPLIIDLVALVLLVTIGSYLWKKKDNFTLYVFFFFWLVIGLGMHAQVFPLDVTVSDRWFYFPIVGILGMVGVFISDLKVKPNKSLINFCLIALIIALSTRTFIRNFDWKNGLTLYGHDITISKDAFDLENNYGVELFRAGKMEEAAVHFKRSTELAPQWWTNWNNLGVIAERQNKLPRAKEYYQKAIDNGHYYLAYENMGSILLQEDPQKAQEFCQKSLLVLPYNAKLWLTLSLADYKLNDKTGALDAAKKAYILSPSQQTYSLYTTLSQNLPLNIP